METDFRHDTIKGLMVSGLSDAEKVRAARFFYHVWDQEPEPIPGATQFKGDVVMLPDTSAKRLAQIVGGHPGTVNGMLGKLDEWGIITRKTEHVPMDRYGNRIPAQSMNPSNGDHYESTTTITVPWIPPLDKLAAPPAPTRKQERDRQTSKANHELANLGRLLKEFECPECHVKGLMALTCHNCGATWTAEEAIAAGANFPENPVSDESSLPENPGKNAIPVNGNSYRTCKSEALTESRNGTKPAPGITSVAGVMTNPQAPADIDTLPADGLAAQTSPVGEVSPNGDTAPALTPGTVDTGTMVPPSLDGRSVELVPSVAGVVSKPQPVAVLDTPADGYDRTKILNNPPADDNLLPSEVLTGADIPAYLDGLGAALTMVEPGGKKAIAPVDDFGDPLGPWPEHPSSLAAVKGHMRQGGNAGILPGWGNWYALDLDADLGAFLKAYPELAPLPRVTRDNATDRGKILFLMESDQVRGKDYAGEGRKVEFKGRGGHVVIAGRHESGAEIRLTTGRLVLIAPERIDAICREWTQGGDAKRMTPTIAAALQVGNRHARRDDGTEVKQAIAWWCANPMNRAAVDQLRRGKGKGKYIAVRPDDKHPSTAADHDVFTMVNRRTYFDYGTKTKLDDFELYAVLQGIDKLSLIKQTVSDFRAANGGR